MGDRVYIVCGGTGGHLAPGIATAQRLMAANVKVELIISDKEVDSRLMQAYPDIPFKRAGGRVFSWNPRRLLMFILCTFVCTFRSWKLLRAEKPHALLAFGGYMSVSFVLSAWILNIPVVLHEANRIPGRSIRSLARFSDMVFLPEGVKIKGCRARRTRHIGMPIRAEVQHEPKEKIRQSMGIPSQAKVLVVVGGSQGAQALNDWVMRHFSLMATDGIWTILVSGPGKNPLTEVRHLISEAGEPVEVRSFSFHTALHELFSCADVVVSRAGAGSIAELITCLTPSILVPFPSAADAHQLANANYLERRGGAVVVEQDDIGNLYREVCDLIFNDWLLGRMRQNLRNLAREDAAGKLSDYLIKQHLGGTGAQADAELSGTGGASHA